MSLPPLKAIDARGAALALLLSILWGANPVAIKLGLEDAPPIRLAWMRFLVGGVVIVAWGVGDRPSARLPHRARTNGVPCSCSARSSRRRSAR